MARPRSIPESEVIDKINIFIDDVMIGLYTHKV